MIILIAGGTHTGKTLLAQRLLEKYSYPYLSIDHLKMGLIRSGVCSLSPECSNEELTDYLWPIVCEIIKTNIENNQNLIVEGCYIPLNYKNDFSSEYLHHIKCTCIIFSNDYINKHYDDILIHQSAIESREDDGYCTRPLLLTENEYNRKMCEKNDVDFIFVNDSYTVVDWRGFADLGIQ